MKIFFSVGEPSGDLHGANLISELRAVRKDFEFTGFGGPKMAAAGCKLEADLTQLAVMWILRVIAKLPQFFAYLKQADQCFRDNPPDAVVLIDFPGFNWWVARRAKAHSIPVFYYGVPQLWAWAPWRVKKLKRLTDHVLCKLPFEPRWFSERGCNAHFVGHPYFDELATREIDQSFVNSMTADSPLVTLLPGSRRQEVDDNLEMMLDAAEQIVRQRSDVRFAIASFNATQAARAQEFLKDRDVEASLFVNKTPELIAGATACIACSGSVSLELLYHEKPSVIVYKVSRIGFVLQDHFRIAKYISLANLLACKSIERSDTTRETVPFPEYLTRHNESADVAADIVEWLKDDSKRSVIQNQLRHLREKFGESGASRRAAEYIAGVLTRPESPVPKPHFVAGNFSHDTPIR